MKYPKMLFLYLVIFAILCILSLPFIRSDVIRVIVIIPLTFIPYFSLKSYQQTKTVQFAREQLKSFLENMCTKVSAGRSIETVFLESRAYMLSIYGNDAIMCKALKSFEEKVASGTPFDEAILFISKAIPCPEAEPLFYVISTTRHLGNKILQVLRHSLFMVGELLIVSKDISSDVSQKRLESTVMSAMPFAVLWSLDLTSKSYLDPAFKSPIGSILMLFSFILAVLAYCLGGFIISKSIYRKSENPFSSQSFSLNAIFTKFYVHFISRSILSMKFLKFLISFIPVDYSLSILRTLKYLYPGKINLLEEYFFVKLLTLILSILSYLTINSFIGISFMYFAVLVIFILILQDVDMNGLASKNKSQMMQDFPTFIGLLSTLLSNGIVLSKALYLCFDTFKNASKPFKNELLMLRGSLGAGHTAFKVIEDFADRCQIPEVSCALLLAAAYDRTGNIENLNLLKLQSSACFSQSKFAARRLLDESSVKLLIPMVLQLICVIVITIAPSLLSLDMI